jgi:CubicO group peptidase (beta-lactamase class C family)
MKNAKIPLLALLLLVVFFPVRHLVTAQQDPTYGAEIEARIKQVEQNLGEMIRTDNKPVILQERMKKYNVPGVSIAVINNYQLEWARGYGFADKEQSKPVTTKTLFQAASISKSLNALGVLKLAQDGKVDLDTDINDYLTSWTFPYDSMSGDNFITLRNLLSHTGGTSVHGFWGYANGEKIPDIVQILDGQPPANSQPVRSMFPAGSNSVYSGGGTSISQLIVADVTGQTYDRYMERNVLKPMGKSTSFFTTVPPRRNARFLATGHGLNGEPVKGKYHHYPEQAAASLWTNPAELTNYIIEIQLALAGKSERILNQEMVLAKLTPVMGNVALGVFIKTAGNDKYFTHGGANVGFRSVYVGSLEGGNGVVVMVNSDNDAIIDEIVNGVAAVYGWKDYYRPMIRQLADVPQDVLDAYVGVYLFNPQVRLVITRNGNSLVGKATGQPEVELFAESQNKFFIKEVDAQVEFVKDSGSGEITQLILHQAGHSIPARKIK